MNILLHLDPLNEDLSMSINRLETYYAMFKELSELGAKVKIYLNSNKIELAQKYFDLSALLFETWHAPSTYNYDALAYSNNLPLELIELSIKNYKKVNFEPDLIITNTSSSLIRKIWKNKLILHYELGFFNRAPFPKFYQFDPLGYYHNSLLSKYPIIGEITKEDDNEYINNIRLNILNSLNLNLSDVGAVDAVYIPLPSKNWTVKSEINYENRTQYITDYACINPNEFIICNEKPGFPISDYEKDCIRKFSNIQLIENEDAFGLGSKLTLICKKTHTFSPSLGLQTLFWENELSVPIQSSMIGWASSNNGKLKLGSYLSKFHIQHFKRIPELVSSWNKYNPYSIG